MPLVNYDLAMSVYVIYTYIQWCNPFFNHLLFGTVTVVQFHIIKFTLPELIKLH